MIAAVLTLALSHASAARARETGHQYFHFLGSLLAGALHLIRKLCSRDIISIARRFHSSIADENIVTAIFNHLAVVRALNQTSARAITMRYPNYVNKYVTDYLAKSLGKQTRREILKYHHEFLDKHVAKNFYEQLFELRPILWQEDIEDDYAISISFDETYHSEGDIAITFSRNNVVLYLLSFTIVPGHLVGVAEPQVLFIGRLQGSKGVAEEIKVATKACHDIAPANLLLAAAEMIASQLGINAISSVGNEEQLAISSGRSSGCYFDYDVFWKSHLVCDDDTKFYTIPVPFPGKSLDQLSAAHRRRARKKRQLKKDIADRVGEAFAVRFVKRFEPRPLASSE